MLKMLNQLLGEDTALLRRYLGLVTVYGVLSGLTILALIPLLYYLLIGQLSVATTWLVVLLFGILICWGVRWHVEQAGVRVGVAILQSGRHRLGEHVIHLPVGWFTATNTARLSHVTTQGMMAVAQLPAHVFTPVISGLVTPIVLLAALLVLHAPLGIAALVALPLLLGVLLLTAKLAQHADRAFQQHFSDTSQRMVEFASAQTVLRAFSGNNHSTRFLEQAMEQQHRSGTRLACLSALSALLNAWAVQTVFAVLLIVTTLWINTLLEGSLTAASIISVIIALVLVSRFVEPLLDIAQHSDILRSARGQLEEIQAIFDAAPLTEPTVPQPPRDASIELRAVRFRYAPHEPDVLNGVSLSITPGSMTALIGESGSGKTTLARLVARFFDADHGSVLVGGVDVRDMSSTQLADHVSQIFQESYLFAGSIADNIRFGHPDASDADLMDAVRLAGVIEIVERLPQGLDTPVGEGGARLSGGERQRIAIARALIKNAPILLVDEATAALDAENQAIITQALVRLRGQRTLLVIAHQLSTVSMADQIIVLDDGRIIEQGAPDELLAQQGRYATFLDQRQTTKGWRITPDKTGETSQ
ncbi:ABC transporter ATP-binding protein [Halomonas citrativorans]|uniref:ABC transporter ATP-binding protein n=4 Tax=Halomonadaceae TaxID=28256 RepID=A0A1R4I3Y8_9GAMM|nr:ABC transporter ATP-binding protein [Halomonas citrativorans]MBE0464098.1 ABC transporter ATP-binding protein [Halomonas colorata]SJN14525.1 ABC transporter ATP-binding protein [Halomonas citrativorans]HCR96330.1 ABC transporter ATP-binding protein [Halomonas sp.]